MSYAIDKAQEADLRSILDEIDDPFLAGTLAESATILGFSEAGEGSVLGLGLPYPERVLAESIEPWRDLLREALGRADLELQLELRLSPKVAAPSQTRGLAGAKPIPGVQHVVAVASGKGGVGKSTTSVQLALGLSRLGLRVGLMDSDIYGPSLPWMMGIQGKPQAVDGKIQPMVRHGISVMSLGFLTGVEDAQVWRGPMVMGAVRQLLWEVDWGELDILLVDLPPGTGDAQLTLPQQVVVAGAVIVSTPQDVALLDVRKGITMFRKVEIPTLGVVENMSFFQCPTCDTRHEIFSTRGAETEAARQGVPFLGRVPLVPALGRAGDRGEPEQARQDPVVDEAYRGISELFLIELERKMAESGIPSGSGA